MLSVFICWLEEATVPAFILKVENKSLQDDPSLQGRIEQARL